MQATSTKSTLTTLFAKLEGCKDRDGYTLIEHIKEMFNRILLKPNDYPLDKFEDLSYLIKLTRLKLKQPLTDKEVNSLAAVMSPKQEFVKKFLSLLSVVNTAYYSVRMQTKIYSSHWALFQI
jgi:uncharacterized protein YfkK (UPF0435 family)